MKLKRSHDISSGTGLKTQADVHTYTHTQAGHQAKIKTEYVRKVIQTALETKRSQDTAQTQDS